MVEIVLTLGIVLLMLVLGVIYKKISQSLKVIRFDKSTELLIERRNIQRSNLKKPVKASMLSKLEVEIDTHLDYVEVESAKELAEFKC